MIPIIKIILGKTSVDTQVLCNGEDISSAVSKIDLSIGGQSSFSTVQLTLAFGRYEIVTESGDKTRPNALEVSKTSGTQG